MIDAQVAVWMLVLTVAVQAVDGTALADTRLGVVWQVGVDSLQHVLVSTCPQAPSVESK